MSCMSLQFSSTKLKRTLVLALFFFGLVSVASGTAGWCAKKKAQTEPQGAAFVTVPVYFVTDREQLGETYGSRRRYASHCAHQMYYGTAYVNVPNTRNEGPGDAWTSLGWKASDQKPPKIAAKDRIDPKDPDTSKKQFFDGLKKALDQSGQKDLCMFVHGASDQFEDCLLDAADLEYAMQKPLVLYSWPSDPKRRGYFIDATNSEWSQGHFNMFCKDLEAMKAEHPLNVISVSHSMGNRLIIRALPVLYGKGLVSDWELVSPDIDADTCRHYVMDYKEVHGKIRLYVSSKDKLLPISQMLAGGYYRLGEASDPILRTSKTGGEKLERIDFTDLDTGFTGHSIPFDLIASMVKTDRPGAGLDLVEQSSVEASRLEKLANRSEGYKSTTKLTDICKRVVRTK